MGVTHYSLNIGGNVRTIGTKPDGSNWTVAIQNPDLSSEESYSEVISFCDMALSTSGSYQRFYYVGDTKYHHIINPFTGKPADTSGENGVVSCSVVTDKGALGDAVATAVVVLGKEKGVALMQKLGLKGLIIDGNMNSQEVGDFEVELKTSTFIVSEDID